MGKMIGEKEWEEMMRTKIDFHYREKGDFWGAIEYKTFDEVRHNFIISGKVNKQTLLVIAYDTMKYNILHDT
jgi:hypothetical protein